MNLSGPFKTEIMKISQQLRKSAKDLGNIEEQYKYRIEELETLRAQDQEALRQSSEKTDRIIKELKKRQEADQGTIEYLNKTLEERNAGFVRLVSENENQAKEIQRCENIQNMCADDQITIMNIKQENKRLKESLDNGSGQMLLTYPSPQDQLTDPTHHRNEDEEENKDAEDASPNGN